MLRRNIFGNTESNNGEVNGNHSLSSHDADIWVFKIDENGLLEWQQCFGGIGDERIEYGVLKNSDNSYIIAGMSDYAPSYDVACTSYNYGIYDYWILEVADTTVGIQENNDLTTSHLFTLFPNPAGEELTCKLQNEVGNGELIIFDILGRKQDEIIIPKGQSKIRIDVSDYPSGIFVAVLKNEKSIIGRGKFVIK